MFPTPIFHRIEKPLSLEQWIQDNPSNDFDLAELVHLGCVYLNHRRIAPKTPNRVQLKPADILRIHPKPRRYPKPFANFRELIVREEADFYVIDKPSGVPVHPTLDNLYENLLTWGSQDLDEELFITHRLDVGTSGLMVYARSASAQTRFNAMLKSGAVHKVYRAVGLRNSPDVSLPPQETWIHWMKPSYRAPKEVLSEEFAQGIRCESRPRSMVLEGDVLTVELQLVTGRTHQIRSQMSALGWPIRGDLMYGSKISYGIDRWDLRCIELNYP